MIFFKHLKSNTTAPKTGVFKNNPFFNLSLKKVSALFFLALLVFSLSCPLCLYSQEEEPDEEEISDYVSPIPEAPAPTFGGFVGTVFKIGVSLSIIVIFIYLTVYVLKKITSPVRPGEGLHFGNLSVVDSLHLGSNKVIYLIRVADEILVLSSTDKDFSLLSKIEDPSAVKNILEERKEKWEKAKPFGDYLRSARKKEQLKMYLKEYVGSVKNIFRKKK
ncbi:MAG: hypothetical protein GF375_03605 [Candidatus Omnitrophica bacterium]|nr:hypothetical protein [Candidatus Omnitrophota bacterium]MBD3269145.1 hypothetical protein [Candidatus Omnitrophota bacterium]